MSGFGGGGGKKAPSLHIEWNPGGRVTALDAGTGRSLSASNLSELTEVTVGHKDALVGIGRGSVFLKSVPLPKAAPEDLRRILSVQVGQLFPLPADQLAFDFVQTGEPFGDGFLTVIAAVRADDLRALSADLRKAGIADARVLPVALGAAAVAARAGRTDALVVEETPTGLALDVVKGGVVRFSRTAPPGSDARREAQRTLAAAGVGDLPLVAAGGLVPAGLEATTETATPVKLLQDAPAGFTFELEEERVRKVQRRVAARTRLGALMMASALLLVALVWVERTDAQAVVTRGQGSWTRELSKLRSIRDLETKKAQQATEVQTAMKAAFEPGQPLSDVAAVVGDALPASAWLTGLNVERGKPVQIRGTATNPEDVARFLRSLSASGRLRDVKLVFANAGKIAETPVTQFSVTATATGNLPMPAATKKKTGSKAPAPKRGSAGVEAG